MDPQAHYWEGGQLTGKKADGLLEGCCRHDGEENVAQSCWNP